MEHNLTLAEHAGARKSHRDFRSPFARKTRSSSTRELAAPNLGDFFVLNPGGGWRSKCWPAAALRRIASARSPSITAGAASSLLVPGRKIWRDERDSAQAGNSPPLALPLGLGPLMALLRRAKFVVSADTGPLHLASALGAPVVGLYGPTDPARNGPYSTARLSVVRNPRFAKRPIGAAHRIRRPCFRSPWSRSWKPSHVYEREIRGLA